MFAVSLTRSRYAMPTETVASPLRRDLIAITRDRSLVLIVQSEKCLHTTQSWEQVGSPLTSFDTVAASVFGWSCPRISS